MTKKTISAPICLIINNPGVYIFGKPMIGIGLHYRFAVTLCDKHIQSPTYKITDSLAATVQKWVTHHYPHTEQPDFFGYSYSYTHNMQHMDFPVLQKDMLAIGIACIILRRDLSLEEIDHVLRAVHPRKDIHRLFALMSAHGKISYVRKEFEFLQQAAFFNNHIPSSWAKQLFLFIPRNDKHEEDSPEKYCELYKYAYHRFPKKTQHNLEDSERFTKQFLLAVYTENKRLLMHSMRQLARVNTYCCDNHVKEEMKHFSRDMVVIPVFFGGYLSFLCYCENTDTTKIFAKKNSYAVYSVSSDSDGILYR